MYINYSIFISQTTYLILPYTLLYAPIRSYTLMYAVSLGFTFYHVFKFEKDAIAFRDTLEPFHYQDGVIYSQVFKLDMSEIKISPWGAFFWGHYQLPIPNLPDLLPQ